MFLAKLKEFPKSKTLTLATVVTFIPFVMLTLFFIVMEHKYIASTGYGILDFELAWTQDAVDKIFLAWGSTGIKEQIFIHLVDLLYPFSYGLFGALLVLIISRKFQGNLQRIGFFIMLAPIAAGIFDLLENVNLHLMLHKGAYVWPNYPFISYVFATFTILKIYFLITGPCFVCMGLTFMVMTKVTPSNAMLYIALIGLGFLTALLLSPWSVLVSLLVGINCVVIIFYFIKLGI